MFPLFQEASCLFTSFFLNTSKKAFTHSFSTIAMLFLGTSFSAFGQSIVPCGPVPPSRHYDFSMKIDSISPPSVGSSYSLGDTITIHFQGAFDTLSYGYIPERMGISIISNLPGLTRIDTGQNTTHMHFVRFDPLNNANVYHLDTLATYCSDRHTYVLSDTLAFNQGNAFFIVGGQEIVSPNQSFQTKGYDVHPNSNYIRANVKSPHALLYLVCDCNAHLPPLCDATMSFEDTVCGVSSVPYSGVSHCTYVNRGSDTVQIDARCSWNYADDWRPFLPGGIFSYHAPYRYVVNGITHISHTGSTLYANSGDTYSFNSRFEIHNFNVDRELIIHFEFRFTDVNAPNNVVIHNLYDTIYTCARPLSTSSINTIPARVYPNPGSDAFQIDFGQNGVYQIHMTDLAGRHIFQDEHQGSLYHFNTSSMAIVSGTYLITYIDTLTGARGQTKVILTP